jgi:hypothetical protein
VAMRALSILRSALLKVAVVASSENLRFTSDFEIWIQNLNLKPKTYYH